jgi:hypothetical protein
MEMDMRESCYLGTKKEKQRKVEKKRRRGCGMEHLGVRRWPVCIRGRQQREGLEDRWVLVVRG